jgi:Fur family peroxide stress response transcriptional regulator
MQQRVQHFLGRCHDAGLTVTPQRIAIYRALIEAHDHPSPEQVYQRVLPEMPSLSLATVYKTLDALCELGVVQEVSVLSDTKRYDANLERHHHLVCSRCHKVEDFYDEQMDGLQPRHQSDGFVAQAVNVQVMGLCRACAGKRS